MMTVKCDKCGATAEFDGRIPDKMRWRCANHLPRYGEPLVKPPQPKKKP